MSRALPYVILAGPSADAPVQALMNASDATMALNRCRSRFGAGARAVDWALATPEQRIEALAIERSTVLERLAVLERDAVADLLARDLRPAATVVRSAPSGSNARTMDMVASTDVGALAIA